MKTQFRLGGRPSCSEFSIGFVMLYTVYDDIPVYLIQGRSSVKAGLGWAHLLGSWLALFLAQVNRVNSGEMSFKVMSQRSKRFRVNGQLRSEFQ